MNTFVGAFYRTLVKGLMDKTKLITINPYSISFRTKRNTNLWSHYQIIELASAYINSI